MPAVKLWEKKGEQFFVPDGTAVNAFGTIEFFDDGEPADVPQNVFSDLGGLIDIGAVVPLDENGRLGTAIYHGESDVVVLQKDSAGSVIIEGDVFAGAVAEIETPEFSKSISVVTTLTGMTNVLSSDQAGQTFSLNKLGGEVVVFLPDASEVDNGKSFFFKVVGFFYNARVVANDIDGVQVVRATRPDVTFELKSNGVTYDYIGLYNLSHDGQRILPVYPRSNLSRGQIDGNIMSVDLTVGGDDSSGDNVLTIDQGSCRDGMGIYDIVVKDTIVKHLDLPWEQGDDMGMADAFSPIAPNVWYHIFRIMNPITWEIDILASTSFNLPILPEGFLFKRYIGSIWTGGASTIRKFIQVDDLFMWYDPPLDHDTNADIGDLYVMTTPLGVNCYAMMHIHSDADVEFYIHSPDAEDAEAAIGVAPLSSIGLSGGGSQATARVWYYTDKQSQVRISPRGNGRSMEVATIQYENVRGRDSDINVEEDLEFFP